MSRNEIAPLHPCLPDLRPGFVLNFRLGQYVCEVLLPGLPAATILSFEMEPRTVVAECDE